MSDPVRAFLEERIEAGDLPGAAWATPASSGAAGLACVEPEEVPATDDTVYDLASLTKPVTAYLVATSGLDLDATAATWLPELRGSRYASATLLDLGTHRAGLPAWRPLYLRGSDRDGYLAAIAAEPRACPEGETLYSDLGYLLLGFALERAMGMPLDRAFDERVARPFGLRSTGYPGTSDRFAEAAATERGNAHERALAGKEGEGYPFRTETIRGVVHDGNAWGLGGVAGHAGLFGTAAEVREIGRAILDGPGALLRPADSGARTFGLVPAGLTDSVRGVLDHDAVGHFGFTGTSLWLEPGRRRVFVLLANRVHPVHPTRSFVAVRRGFHERA